MGFHWRADDGPTFNDGLVALCLVRGSGPVLLRNPIFFCNFSGGENPPVPPLVALLRLSSLCLVIMALPHSAVGWSSVCGCGIF